MDSRGDSRSGSGRSGRGSPSGANAASGHASGSGGGTPPTAPSSAVALEQLDDGSTSMTLAWNDLSVWVRKRKEGTGFFSRQKYEHKQILNSGKPAAIPPHQTSQRR